LAAFHEHPAVTKAIKHQQFCAITLRDGFETEAEIIFSLHRKFANGVATFRAEAIDTEGHVFRGEWPAQPAG
jgi:hypothetical protein